jgi:hypothetical protein
MCEWIDQVIVVGNEISQPIALVTLSEEEIKNQMNTFLNLQKIKKYCYC